MMSETGESGFIKIYEAIDFPYNWKLAHNIIKVNYWDISIFNYNGLWQWMVIILKK